MTNSTNLRSAIVAAALSLTACGEPSSGGTSSTTTAKSEPAPEVALNATGKAEGVEFTVTDVATPNQIGPAPVGLKAEAGETFVVVSYTLKNTGEKQLPFLERPAISLIDAAGNSYSPDEVAGGTAAAMLDDPSGMSSDLNPNVSARTKTAWKVDKAAFDRATWKLVVATDPQLTFALK